MARRILRPFAESGDRTAIADDTEASGLVSYEQGYPPRYELNPETDPSALRINRARYNQLGHDVSDNIKEWQEQLAPNFITTASNGGTAFSYALGMVVWDGTGYRRSTSAANTADVTDNANWEDYDFTTPSTGIGQSWVTFDPAQRLAGVIYTNTTDLPIHVTVDVNNILNVTSDVDGVRLTNHNGRTVPFNAIVPPGSTYNIGSGLTFFTWSELR